MGGPKSREVLESLSTADRPFGVRTTAVVALAGIDLPAASKRAAEMLASAPAGADPAPLISGFLERKNGPAALTDALAKEKLSPDIAKLSIRAVRASASEQPAFVATLTSAGGLTATAARMPRGAELEQMVAEIRSQGDAARGEAIFRRQEESCSKCHAIGGVGGQVAPDLSSIGASAPIDYLIESILVPSAKIKDNFDTTIVTTDAGKVYTGIKNRQTDKDLVLRDATDHEIAIPLATIDTKERSRVSLMPVGLADGLTHAELVDLVRFLSELGKVGPYSLSKAPIARRWQALVLQTHAIVGRRDRRRAVAAMDAGLQPSLRRPSALRFAANHRRQQRTNQHRPLPPRLHRRGPSEVQTEFPRRLSDLDRPKTDRSPPGVRYRPCSRATHGRRRGSRRSTKRPAALGTIGSSRLLVAGHVRRWQVKTSRL